MEVVRITFDDPQGSGIKLDFELESDTIGKLLESAESIMAWHKKQLPQK